MSRFAAARRGRRAMGRAVDHVQNLERRVMLCALTHDPMLHSQTPQGVQPAHAYADAAPEPNFEAISSLDSYSTNSSGLPLLNSNPDAVAKLLLDFDGRAEYGNFPAYSSDTDPATFNPTEQAAIVEVWQRVSEKFSPFNLNVTTVDPGNHNPRETGIQLVGWGQSASGYAYVGGFYTGLFGVAYAANFTSNKIVADIAAHEAGHLMGLWHQSLYDANGVKLQEYRTGDAYRAPIMGYLYPPQRAQWAIGPSSQSYTITQDDLAIITNKNDAYGYRPDDHPDDLTLADPLDVASGAVSGAGIIEKTTDADVFSFDAGAGTIDVSSTVSNFSTMLETQMQLYRLEAGTYRMVASAATSPPGVLGERIVFNAAAAGSYRLVVSSQGLYGDLGTYTISGTIPSGAGAPVASASDVRADRISAGQVDLSWTDNSNNESEFRIERSSDNGSNWSVVGAAGENITAFFDTTTTSGVTYWYRVIATDGTDDAAASDVARAVMTPGPDNLRVTGVTGGSVSLAWDDVAGEIGYVIDRSLDGVNWEHFGAMTGDATAYTAKGLAVNTTYSFRVRSTKDGYSLPGNAVSAQTAAVAGPGIVQNLAAAPDSVYAIGLTWDNIPSSTRYDIERSDNGTDGWQLISWTTTNQNSFVDWHGQMNRTFYYRVRAMNDGGYGGYSGVVSGTTTVTAPPVAPSDLYVYYSYNTYVIVGWSDNSDNEQDFYVEQYDPIGDTWTRLGVTGEPDYPYFEMDGLTNNASYTVRAIAFNPAGESAPSASFTFIAPTATPTNLVVSATNYQSINLSWTDVIGEQFYKVQRMEEGVWQWIDIGTTAPDTTTFVDTTAKQAQWYRYQVFANNGSTDSAPTNEVRFLTPTGIPNTPTNVSTSTANNRRAVKISWTDVSTETSYPIERSADGVSGWAQIGTAAQNVTSYFDDTVTSGATYYYRVSATNANGTSAPSSVVSGAAPFIAPVAAPTNLRFVSSTASTITIAWDDNSGNELYFSIERLFPDPYGDDPYFAEVGTIGPDVTTWVDGLDGDLEPGSYYTYRVRAYNSAGYSATTNMLGSQTRPDAVWLTSTTAVSTDQINLAWGFTPGATGFRIERSLTGHSFWSTVATLTNGSATSHSDTGLDSNITYHYRVTATSAVGDGAAGNVLSATTLDSTEPGTPQNLAAAPVSTTRIDLTWSDVTNEDAYRVERSPDGSSGWTSVATPGQNVTSFSDLAVAAGTRYYYRVIAVNSFAESAPSATATALTIPAAPANFTATPFNHARIDLAWNDTLGETSYRIERSASGSPYQLLTTVGQNATSYADTTVVPGTGYNYRVIAVNSTGDSAPSNFATAMAPPAAPSSLTAMAVSANQVNLSWSDVVGESGYQIERSTDGINFTQIGTTGANVTTYSDTTAAAATTYFYRVRGSNAGGNGAYSPTANATTHSSVPQAPTNLAAAALSPTSVRLNWTDNATNETGFRVYRSTNGTSWTLVTTLGANANTYTNTGLKRNTLYYYKVVAFNAIGPSPDSNVAQIRTPR